MAVLSPIPKFSFIGLPTLPVHSAAPVVLIVEETAHIPRSVGPQLFTLPVALTVFELASILAPILIDLLIRLLRPHLRYAVHQATLRDDHIYLVHGADQLIHV